MTPGKGRRAACNGCRIGSSVAGLLVGIAGLNALGGPAGMTVQQGAVSATQNGPRLDITASHNSVINWQSFNIGVGESVNFHQPNAVSVAWNRILDANPSQIWGSLNANGIVVLMNQSGFYFGPNSSILVGGFIATTVPIAATSPIGAGMWQYNGTPPLASIINYGEIKAQSGGSIFMIAEKIENHGVLSAPDGTLGLYAGKEVLLSERPDGRSLNARVNLPAGSVDNDGKLLADAGTIALHAQVVNNNGLVQANSVRERNGIIELVASERIELNAGSLLQAGGDPGGVSDGGSIRIQSAGTFADQAGSKIEVGGGPQGGNGGSMEISAPFIASLHSRLDGRAAPGWIGGKLFFDPTDIILTSASDASSAPSGTLNAGDLPGASLRLNVNVAFAGFSQIQLQATRDIRLEQGTLWSLNDSTGISDPGSRLTLEAGNNIIFADNAHIVGGPGWSLSLKAGVDFSSPSLAVTRGRGSIYLNGAPGANGSGAIEAYDGSISLDAGHEVLVGGGYVRTGGGGGIQIVTGDGDVNAGNKADGYEFSRFGAVISSQGLGGIGTAVGGDVSIHSGRDIIALNASSDLVRSATAGVGAFGGGNVELDAARDVKGKFIVRDGAGTIHAGRDIGDSSSGAARLALAKGSWTASAGQDLFLREVFNPNGSLNSDFRVRTLPGTKFQFDYAPDSRVSLGGGNSVQLLGKGIAATAANSDRLPIYAPRLDITAGAGGVVLGNDLILYPSPLGSLSIHTTDGGSLRSMAGGFYQFVVSDSGSPDYKTFATDHATTLPLHLNSGDAGVHLDISGDVQNVFLRVPRQADLIIHGNTLNFAFEGQNLSLNDVTRLQIGGDYLSRSDRTFVQIAAAPDLTIFDPLITVNAALGSRITYNSETQRLGFQGIMTAADRDFLLHPLTYHFEPTTGDVQRDAQRIPILFPAQFTTDVAAINDLYARSQDIPTSPLARSGLVIGGPGSFEISARSMNLGITAGIRSIGPLLNPTLAKISLLGADLKVTLSGDLEMTSSQIASFNGGDITLIADGRLDIGSQEQFSSDDTPKGIYTGHGGEVWVEANGDIDINGSRIASYDGGDVTVISNNGNIDAGSGGKGFFNVTTAQLDPGTGKLVTRNDQFFGSGIVALTRLDSEVMIGDILVRAAGDISANAGGVLQLALNHEDQTGAQVLLEAGGDILANQSGIIGGNVTLKAGGDIVGLVVASQNLGVTAQQNVSVTALAGGTANVSAGQNVSGSIVGGGNVSVAGGEVSASVISTGGSAATSGDTSAAKLGAFSGVAAPVAQQTTTEADKKALTAVTEIQDEEEKKKRAAASAPVLSKTTGRVTVILPAK